MKCSQIALVAAWLCASSALAEITIQPTASAWVNGRLETSLQITGEGELTLAVKDNTCPAQLLQKQIVAPTNATLVSAPKAKTACLLTVSANDAFLNETQLRLEIAPQGEAGFQVVVKGNGTFTPSATPAFGADANLSVVGGWGDFHLDAKGRLDASGIFEGRVLASYANTQVLLADSTGWTGAVAGDVGPGLYFSQDIAWFRFGGVWPFASQPFGQPRLGIGVRLPNVCASASLNTALNDPILGLQFGYGGFVVGGQWRPVHPDTRWQYNASYRDTSLEAKLNGTEHDASFSSQGFFSVEGLEWLAFDASASLDSTGFSTRGTFDSLYFGGGWAIDPSGANSLSLEGRVYDLIPDVLQQLRFGTTITFSSEPGFAYLGALWTLGENWELYTRFGFNTSFYIGSELRLTYTNTSDGFFRIETAITSSNLRVPDTITGAIALTYAHPTGIAARLELQTPIVNPNAISVSLQLLSWSFLPTEPATPNVRQVPLETVPQSAPFIPCR